jgi:hypothetical protein
MAWRVMIPKKTMCSQDPAFGVASRTRGMREPRPAAAVWRTTLIGHERASGCSVVRVYSCGGGRSGNGPESVPAYVQLAAVIAWAR